MDNTEFVTNFLNAKSKCYGHCDSEVSLHLKNTDGKLVGVYSCPKGYVSRIVAYYPAQTPANPEWLRGYVEKLFENKLVIEDTDIRVATRYPWNFEFGENRQTEDGPLLREHYWTQNYRRSKSEDPERITLFSCVNCSKLFIQPASATTSQCAHCSQKNT